MLNMKVDPEMSMKTKDRMTQCPKIIRAFVPGRHHFCRNKRQSTGIFAENAEMGQGRVMSDE
jgi:hypothetical protein